MLIGSFNANKPLLIPLLLIITAVLYLPAILHPEAFSVITDSAPFSKWLLPAIYWNHHAAMGVGMALVILQALLINRLLNRIKFFQRINFVPALMYVVVSAMFVDFLMPGPQMFANTFVILVLSRLFDIYKLQRCYAEIFDVGFLVAVASLFSLPAISLSLFLFIGLGSLRAFNIREYIIGLLGILTPYFLIITYYFWIDKLPDFLGEHFGSVALQTKLPNGFGLAFQVIGPAVLLMLLAAAYYLQANYLKSNIQVRKYILLITWCLLLLGASFVLDDGVTVKHFTIINVPLSIILSYFMLHIKKRKPAEIIFTLFLLLILVFQYLPGILNL
jgi:hypothetical protein